MKQSPDIQNQSWLRRKVGSPALFLFIMTFGYAVYAADRYVLASVLGPLQTSLAITSSQVALLGAAQYIGVTCFVFVAGHLSDKYGGWSIIFTGVVVFTAFTWLIGLSSNFLEAFIFRLVSGFGEGIFWPVAMASVAGYFKNRKGLALGIFYDGFDIGGVAGLSIGGIAYYLTDSWRPAFIVAPALGVVALIGVTLTRSKFENRSIGNV
ncbi:MAG: MFS transporter, partial [Thaumarchaeota archaeon]|nr:MFS transporter [Nitrososphaerota archaeon]